MATAANIVYSAGARRLHEMPESVDQVPGMDVVADLLSLVAEHRIGLTGNRAFDEIGEKTVQHRPRMARSAQTATAETGRFEAEITAIFLDEDIGRQFRRAEQAMQTMIDAHRLIDAMCGERMLRSQLPPGLLLDERQDVWCVAIYLLGAGKDENRARAAEPGRLQLVKR